MVSGGGTPKAYTIHKNYHFSYTKSVGKRVSSVNFEHTYFLNHPLVMTYHFLPHNVLFTFIRNLQICLMQLFPGIWDIDIPPPPPPPPSPSAPNLLFSNLDNFYFIAPTNNDNYNVNCVILSQLAFLIRPQFLIPVARWHGLSRVSLGHKQKEYPEVMYDVFFLYRYLQTIKVGIQTIKVGMQTIKVGIHNNNNVQQYYYCCDIVYLFVAYINI